MKHLENKITLVTGGRQGGGRYRSWVNLRRSCCLRKRALGIKALWKCNRHCRSGSLSGRPGE